MDKWSVATPAHMLRAYLEPSGPSWAWHPELITESSQRLSTLSSTDGILWPHLSAASHSSFYRWVGYPQECSFRDSKHRNLEDLGIERSLWPVSQEGKRRSEERDLLTYFLKLFLAWPLKKLDKTGLR